MSRFRRIIWLTFCEADQRYIDLFRVAYALGLLTFLILSIWAGWRGEAWDPMAFGTGLGGLLIGGGAGVGLRGRLEDGKTNDLKNDDQPPFDLGNPNGT